MILNVFVTGGRAVLGLLTYPKVGRSILAVDGIGGNCKNGLEAILKLTLHMNPYFLLPLGSKTTLLVSLIFLLCNAV